MIFEPGTRVHVIGVGGAGMSGVARLLVEMGCVVSGSDAASSSVLDELSKAGVRVHVGHDASYVQGADVVLYSPAVGSENVERQSARRSGQRLMERSQLLAALARDQRVIGLTGTHGKTTATSMMATVLAKAGRDDSRLLGAPVKNLGANGHFGPGDLILEVDESFGSFLELRPYALGVLNVDADHLDFYGTVQNVELAFAELMGRTKDHVVVYDDPGARRAAALSGRDVVVVGTSESVRWRIHDIRLSRREASFVFDTPFGRLDVALGVTGLHNVANAATVGALALLLGVTNSDVQGGLANFVGAPRRFEFLGSWRSVDIYEDYAHLPGEVRATIAGARAAGYERVGVVFQPHRVTRTLALVEQFADCFAGSALLIVSDIYRAGEPNPTQVSGEIVADAVRASDPDFTTLYAASFEEVRSILTEHHDELDVVVLVGAGDIASVATRLDGGVRV